MGQFSVIISAIALVISLFTLWITRYRKGAIKMTRPTTIFLGPDGGGTTISKVFIRTLLYSTSDRGQYIENMYIRLRAVKGKPNNFVVWICGERDNLARGSGLFIDRKGIVADHHFLINDAQHRFGQGKYTLEVYAIAVGGRPKRLFRQKIEITQQQMHSMRKRDAGIYYDWDPCMQNYLTRIDKSEAKFYRP